MQELLTEGTEQEITAAELEALVLSSAEVAECTCPDWCERDHDRD